MLEHQPANRPWPGTAIVADKGFSGEDFEEFLAGPDLGLILVRPARRDQKAPRYFPNWLRQRAEAIIWTLKSQPGLERHGGRVPPPPRPPGPPAPRPVGTDRPAAARGDQVLDSGRARNLDGGIDGVGSDDRPEVLAQLGAAQQFAAGDGRASVPRGSHGPYQRLRDVGCRPALVRVQARAQFLVNPVQRQPLGLCSLPIRGRTAAGDAKSPGLTS